MTKCDKGIAKSAHVRFVSSIVKVFLRDWTQNELGKRQTRNYAFLGYGGSYYEAGSFMVAIRFRIV